MDIFLQSAVKCQNKVDGNGNTQVKCLEIPQNLALVKYLSNLLYVPLVVAEIFTTLLPSTTDNVILLIISQLFTQFLLSLSSPLRVSSVRFWPVVCMQGMTTHFKTSKALKVRVRSLIGECFIGLVSKKKVPVLHPLVLFHRSRGRWARMPRRSATTSWWPCPCGSSTSTCVG